MGLVLILGLGLGLLLALALNGRMGHLRALALPLPAWSVAVDDAAGVLRGSATLGEAVMGWQLQTIGREGPVWQFRFDGPGLMLAAPAVLSVPVGAGAMPALMLAPLTGHLDSAALSGGNLQGWPDARLSFTRGHLAFDLGLGAVSGLEVEGLASAVVFESQSLGSGRFTLTQVPEGYWRLAANLAAEPEDSTSRLTVELQMDLATGQAVLAILPGENAQSPAESVLRTLSLPAMPDAVAGHAP